MGHQRLGTLPETPPWRRVVRRLGEGGPAAAVVAEVATAAAAALARAGQDAGVRRVVGVLAAMTAEVAGRGGRSPWQAVGRPTHPPPSAFELAAAIADAHDRWHRAAAVRRTDFSELAVLAAVEAVTAAVAGGGDPPPDPAGVRAAVAGLGTGRGFPRLVVALFARFARRFVLYHLDRELSHHVGGNGRFADHESRRRFADELAEAAAAAAEPLRGLTRRRYPGGPPADPDDPSVHAFATEATAAVAAGLAAALAADREAPHG